MLWHKMYCVVSIVLTHSCIDDVAVLKVVLTSVGSQLLLARQDAAVPLKFVPPSPHGRRSMKAVSLVVLVLAWVGWTSSVATVTLSLPASAPLVRNVTARAAFTTARGTDIVARKTNIRAEGRGSTCANT